MTEQNLAHETTVREGGLKQEFLWLAPALLAAVVLFYVYLESHPYPSFGAGLYLLVAEQISQAGYALPETVPYYTEGGVPFAYPPLMFYAVAALRDLTGVDPITVARYLPGLVTVAYLVPVYLLARDLLGSREQAALACLVVAVSPPALRWHISAGGIVRAPAFLFAVSGIYAGLRLYRDRDGRWVVPALALFTLTVLTHPLYTAFFVLSFLLLFLRFDRTGRGFARGAVVGLGGVVLTAPWWTQVIAYHGVDVFTGAAGTHGGIGGGVRSLVTLANAGSNGALVEQVWAVVPLLGIAYLLSERRYFLPVWFVAVVLAFGKPRLSVVVGALVTAVFLLEGVAPWLKHRTSLPVGQRGVATAALVALATVGLAGASFYAAGDLNAHAGSPSLPQFLDHDDVEAMEWVRTNTAPSATFVVQGDTAEWFPQQTHRTMLVGPWGVEWKSPQQYQRQLKLFRAVSACTSATCTSRTLSDAGVRPDYVYLPKGEFTVRGMEHRRTSKLAMSMHLSPRYRTVFENDGVIVFEVVGEAEETGEDSSSSEAA